jgi:hypothetical protein
MAEKLRLGVVWNRPDIIDEIIDNEKEALTSTDHRRGLNEALELSLLLDRPEIFTILANKGAQKEAVNLKKLYYFKSTKQFFRKIPAYALGKNTGVKLTELADNRGNNEEAQPLPGSSQSVSAPSAEFSKDTPKARNAIKNVFKTAGSTFSGYQAVLDDKFDSVDRLHGLLPDITISKSGTIRKKKKKTYDEDISVSFTDFLIWSIIVNRFEMSKSIWRETTLPVHSALLACQLYRFLADFSSDKETYLDNSNWFEEEAIKVMDELEEYEDVKNVLKWKWKEMANQSALEIAGEAECKKFVGHQHVQYLLDEMFYSDKYGKIEATTTSFRIWATILLPIPLVFGLYKNTPAYEKSPWLFYHLPIVKFWTNTMFYCGFLALQAYVLCNLYFAYTGEFLHAEIVLWIWVGALLLEEIMQFARDRESHFEHLSNQMDFLLIILHLIYMILRWASYGDDADSKVFSGAINTLIVACLFSWGRLLNVFAINSSLGPLFFVIIRLFRDIFLWLFVFLIFAISFQVGFVNITMQAGMNSTATYPSGTLPVSFFAIVGEWTYITEDTTTGWDDTPLGIALLSIYAMVSQIMLVNLLIAMMGSTYSNVSDNSMEEWKFYRLEMVLENQVTSFHPPPVNLVIIPFEVIRDYRKITNATVKLFSLERTDSDGQKIHPDAPPKETSTTSMDGEDPPEYDALKVIKKMRKARNDVVNKEEIEDNTSVLAIVAGVKETLRTITNERENDRTFTQKRFKELEVAIRDSGGAGNANAGPAPNAAPPAALQQLTQQQQQLQQQQQHLADQNQRLVEQNQQLAQQNQQILALLQQQQSQQQQLSEQLQQVLRARPE